MLNLVVNGPTTTPTYTAPTAVTSPATDEDFGNITISQGATTILNNSTVRNSLVGTIGTATGTAGSYSNFTSFGPYNLTNGQTYVYSISSLQNATAYSNSMAIYIDYNRNGVFTDAGEAVYVATATSLGAHTITGSFTVPAYVSLGYTRMRVISNEGLITGPTMTVGYGEYEEYTINLQPATDTYVWTDNIETVFGYTNPFEVTVSAPTTYSGVTYVSGCSIGADITPNLIALPSAPTTTASSQCGAAVPTCSASGGAAGNYRWYTVSTGGTALVGENNATLFSYSISATTTFYVAISNGTCESARTPVVVTITSSDLLSITSTPVSLAAVCLGTSIDLTPTQTGSTNTYVLTWAASTAGSGLLSSSAGTLNTAKTVTPTTTGTFTYTINGLESPSGCTGTFSVIAEVINPNVGITATASATPSTLCAGSSTNLNITLGLSGTSTLGSGTTSSSANTTPFSGAWGGIKGQYIILASELTVAGLTAGNITSIGLNFNAAVTATYTDLTIQLGTTLLSAFPATLSLESTGLSTFYGPSSLVNPTAGVNTFSLSSPYAWDGTSNIIISTNWSNNVGTSITASLITTTTTFNSSQALKRDNLTPAALLALTGPQGTGLSTVGTTRPNFILTGNTSPSPSSFSWSDGSTNIGSTNPLSLTVSTATTFTGTATINGCPVSASTTPTITPLPSAPTTTASSQCGAAVPTCSASGGSAGNYRWYTVPTGGTAIAGEVNETLSSHVVNSATTLYVSISNGTCESTRTPVSISFTSADVLSLSSTPAILTSVCLGTSIDLTPSQTGSTNTYALTWAASGAGSGALTSSAGTLSTAKTITPTAAGTYTYTINGLESGSGCTGTASVIATIVNPNAGLTATAIATPAEICAGSPTSLALNFGSTTSGTYPTSSASTPLTDEDFGNVIITQGATTILNNTTAGGSLVGTIGTATGTPGGYSDFTAFGPYVLKTGVIYNFSLSSITQGGSYGNTVAMYVDYNRDGDFADAGEAVYIEPTTTNGPHTKTGTFTVPANASLGYTRMRLMVNEGTITSPTQAITWGEFEEYMINLQPDVTSISWSDGVTSIGATNPISVSPTTATTYTVTASLNGCPISANVAPIVTPLPSAPTATNSSQCGDAIPAASVAGTNGQAVANLTWYTTSMGSTIAQDSYALVPYYSNDFASSLTSGSVVGSVAGNASFTGGLVQLTSNTGGVNGGFTVPAIGSNSSAYQFGFKLTTTGTAGNMADGMSFNFGDDVATTSGTAEAGSGSKLSVTFDIYGAVAPVSGQGIRVKYAGVELVYYTTSLAWINSPNVPMLIDINSSGQLSMSVNGTSIISNLQLPPAYLAANKSTWKYAYLARTGGSSALQAIDDVVIKYSTLVSATTFPTSISSTTTWYVSESVNGCVSPQTALTATVTPAPAFAISNNTTTICGGDASATPITVTTGASDYDTYTWSPTLGITGNATSGWTFSPAAVTTPATVNYTLNVSQSSGANCTSNAPLVLTVNPKPTLVTAASSANPICLNGTVNLTSGSVSNLSSNLTYTESFESGLPTGWTITNAGSGNNWTVLSPPAQTAATGTGALQYLYNFSNAANSWAFTQGFTLQAGVTYTIASKYRGSGTTFVERFKVTVGNAATVAAQTTTIQDITSVTNTAYLDQSGTFTPTTSGTYYFAWNCYSIANKNYLIIDDVSITGTNSIPSTYAWTSSPSGYTSTIQNPTGVTPSASTTYTVEATNDYGCKESNTTTVNILTANPVSVAATTGALSSGDYLWNGLTSTAWDNAVNWYQYDGSAFLFSSSVPVSTDRVFVLPNSPGNTCVTTAPTTATVNVSVGNGEAKDFFIGNGATVVVDAGKNLAIKGNWTNNGTFTPDGTSIVTFDGTAAQAIGGANVTSFSNLTVNKATGLLSLNKAANVTGSLTMTIGDIQTSSANLLTIGTSAALPGTLVWVPLTGGSILGPIRRYFSGTANNSFASGVFPVGKAGVNRYAQVNFTTANNVNSITAEYVLGLPAGITNGGYNGLPLTTDDGQLIQNYENEGYWSIAAEVSDNLAKYELSLRGNQLSTTASLLPVRIIKSISHTSWDNNGVGDYSGIPSGTVSDFTIRNTDMQGFSFFNIGSNDANPLPVNMLDFTATCDKSETDVKWSTASESNSKDFTVERSRDLNGWQEVATVSAAGNSSQEIAYLSIDSNPLSGVSYYRLIQRDLNGSETVYGPITVNCESASNSINVYPNPTNGSFTVELASLTKESGVSIQLTDMTGKVIDTRSIDLEVGNNQLYFNKQLESGIYLVRVLDKKSSFKTVKLEVRN